MTPGSSGRVSSCWSCGNDTSNLIGLCDPCIVADGGRTPSPLPTRADVIEALSWHEDMQRGRWGVEYATEVVEHLEAVARTDGLATAPARTPSA